MDNRDITNAIIGMREDISSLRSDVKAAFKRIDEQREQNTVLVHVQMAIARIDEKLDTHLLQTQELDKRIAELESKPAKLWWVIVSGVLSAIASLLISKVFI